MTTIADLEEHRTVEGIYAVARKERLRTRGGSSYLALELVDASGRIPARVWNDVDMLDGRFDTGDAVRVLGRVERFRDSLQLDVRTIEPAAEVDPAGMAPAMRRDANELECQVGRAVLRPQPLLLRDRVHALERPVLLQLRDRGHFG